jgi:lipoprotein-releasing system permease protein
MYVVILCLRYLRARRGVILSILALATGVTALIVVLAVMNGFSALLRDRTRGSLSDIVVEREDFWGTQGAEALRRELAAIPHVVGCSAHLTGIAFLSLADERLPLRIPVEFVALDPAEEAQVGAFGRWLEANGPQDGEAPGGAVVPFELPDGGRPERPVILGAEVLERLLGAEMLARLPGLVRPGTRVLLATPISWEDHNVAVFTVTGFYKSGMYKSDANTVFLPLTVAQQWRRAPDTATSFHLCLDDFRHAPEVVEAARRVVAPRGEFFVDTWQRMRRQLLAALVAERTIWVIVLTLLLGLAGFSVVAVLNLIVFQRRRDIGVVRSVGGSRRGVAGTFVLYGLAVGLVGAALGTVTGSLILTHIDWLEDHLPGGLFPRDVFYLEEHIPWQISPVTVALFALLGVLVSVLASLYPAWRASRLQPSQILHRMV